MTEYPRSIECNQPGTRRAPYRHPAYVHHCLHYAADLYRRSRWCAAYVDLHIFNPIVALAIATFKAVIVILFFMHVKYQSRLIKMTVSAGFFTFLVLTTMTLSDYISRAWGLW